MSDITSDITIDKHCAVALGILCVSVVTHVPYSLPKHVVSPIERSLQKDLV